MQVTVSEAPHKTSATSTNSLKKPTSMAEHYLLICMVGQTWRARDIVLRNRIKRYAPEANGTQNMAINRESVRAVVAATCSLAALLIIVPVSI